VIRQAHTYLVGAVGAATLIAIAIAVFVLLVSAQVFRDWPIAALGDGGGESAAVSAAQPASGPGPGDAASSAVGGRAVAARGATARPARDGVDGSPGSVAGSDGVVVSSGSQEAAAPVGSTGGGAGEGGSGGSPQAASGAPSPGPAAAGGGSSSSSGGGGGGGGGNSGGSAEGGSGGAGGGSSGGGAPSTSGQVTETVNNTVSGVDETALGGTLNNTGVTTVTEGVVNGVAGPESTVGKVVDEAAGAVGGLLGGKR